MQGRKPKLFEQSSHQLVSNSLILDKNKTRGNLLNSTY